MADTKKRNGWLTAWLIVMAIVNGGIALSYFIGRAMIAQILKTVPGWVFPVVLEGIVFSLFNLVCAIALFRWKKWGFWGLCVSTVITLIVNLASGLGIAASFAGIVGVGVLYAILNVEKENQGWPQLE